MGASAAQTFGSTSMSTCDEDDDEGDECQEQEEDEDVAQRQEKVVPLVREDDGDDPRWLRFWGVWVVEQFPESQHFFVLHLTNTPECCLVVRHHKPLTNAVFLDFEAVSYI